MGVFGRRYNAAGLAGHGHSYAHECCRAFEWSFGSWKQFEFCKWFTCPRWLERDEVFAACFIEGRERLQGIGQNCAPRSGTPDQVFNVAYARFRGGSATHSLLSICVSLSLTAITPPSTTFSTFPVPLAFWQVTFTLVNAIVPASSEDPTFSPATAVSVPRPIACVEYLPVPLSVSHREVVYCGVPRLPCM
jgi:hypothetical protein